MTKKAYLTLDDSPSIYMKEKVDYLIAKKIPALFFCRGDFMEKYPDLIIYAIQKGYVIGNHSYSHPRFCDITIEECFDQISKTDEIIDDLYVKANVKRGLRYFRYPQGIKGNITYLSFKIFLKCFDPKFKQLEKHLKKLNYTPLKIKTPKIRYPEIVRLYDTDSYWTIDIREWKMIQDTNYLPHDVDNYIDRHLSYKNGNEILLIHDHEQTHKHFKHFIDKFISKRFTFLDIP